jgi:ribonuclease BN (tRNA processing enzyme)
MIIKILGSGTMLSDERRNPACFLLKSLRDLALLDMGPGSLLRLKQLKIPLESINTLFLTHFHLDHCSDVMPFLMNRFLIDKYLNKSLTIYGPPTLVEWFSAHQALNGSWLHESAPNLTAIEFPFYWSGYRISVYLNGHTNDSISYRFEKKAIISFSGDTGYSEGLVKFLTDSTYAFLECSLKENPSAIQHLTPIDCAKIANEAHIKEILIHHIYPENDTADLQDKIQTLTTSKVHITKDFYHLEA